MTAGGPTTRNLFKTQTKVGVSALWEVHMPLASVANTFAAVIESWMVPS